MASNDGAVPPRLGDRVRDSNGFVATVRYIGPVCSAKDPEAIWAGVEFDDPTRGKHDGAVEGPEGRMVRYFSLEDGGSGSFLKLDKVDCGVSFVEALEAQYVAMDAPLEAPSNVFDGAFAQTNVRGGRKPIEFYGETKIRRRQQVGELECCTLREAGVSRAGDGTAIEAAAGHFTGLDLKANLLSDWDEVGSVARCLPHLRRLDLGGNRFRYELPLPDTLAFALGSLRVLAVNSCGLRSWRQLSAFGAAAPLLEEVYAANNDLSDVLAATGRKSNAEALTDETAVTAAAPRNGEGSSSKDLHEFALAPPPESVFAALRVLDVSETGLTEWRQAAAFAALPRLASLSLNHNRIAAVDPAAADPAAAASAPGRFFPALESLALSSNLIASWVSVDRLAALPALRALRFGANPCTAGLTASEVRAACVARLARLKRFNASDVTARERSESEKAYLRVVRRELADAAVAAAAAAAEKVAAVAEEAATVEKEALANETAMTTGADSTAGLDAPAPVGDFDGEGGPTKAATTASTAAAGPKHAAQAAAATEVAAAAAAAAVEARHPRYSELLALHGLGASAAPGATTGSGSLAGHVVSVWLSPVAASCCGKEPITKRIPGSLTVRRLKQLCQRLFGVDADLQVLYFRFGSGGSSGSGIGGGGGSGELTSPLDDDEQTLVAFGVCDGCEVFVNEINKRPAVNGSEEKARADAKMRLERELRHAEAMDAARRGQVRSETAAAQRAAADVR